MVSKIPVRRKKLKKMGNQKWQNEKEGRSRELMTVTKNSPTETKRPGRRPIDGQWSQWTIILPSLLWDFLFLLEALQKEIKAPQKSKLAYFPKTDITMRLLNKSNA